MDDLIVAYIAGLFDGEGHAYIATYRPSRTSAKYRRMTAAITNTYREVLEEIRGHVGSGVITKKAPSKNGRKDCYQFTLTNAKAVRFLEQIQPYLRIKKERIALLLSQPYVGRVE